MTNTEAADLAAKYWADKLRTPPSPADQVQHAELYDDPARAAFLHMTMPTMKAPSADNLENFHRELAGILALEIARKGFPVYVGVDYDPCALLCRAADLAGFALGKFMLPWKHAMVIDADEIEVKEGYGQPHRTLECE